MKRVVWYARWGLVATLAVTLLAFFAYAGPLTFVDTNISAVLIFAGLIVSSLLVLLAGALPERIVATVSLAALGYVYFLSVRPTTSDIAAKGDYAIAMIVIILTALVVLTVSAIAVARGVRDDTFPQRTWRAVPERALTKVSSRAPEGRIDQ